MESQLPSTALLAHTLVVLCGGLYKADFPEMPLGSFSSEKSTYYDFASVLERALERYEFRRSLADVNPVPVPYRKQKVINVKWVDLPESGLELLKRWQNQLPVEQELSEFWNMLRR